MAKSPLDVFGNCDGERDVGFRFSVTIEGAGGSRDASIRAEPIDVRPRTGATSVGFYLAAALLEVDPRNDQCKRGIPDYIECTVIAAKEANLLTFTGRQHR